VGTSVESDKTALPESDEQIEVEEIDPKEIDGSFVPRLRPEVAALEIEGEAVLHVEGTHDLHWLNGTGSIVASFFDGSTSLHEAIGELSEAFHTEPEVVGNDVLEITREVGRAGLLEGVKRYVPEPARPPEGLDVGTELPSFSFPDLEGNPVAFEDLRGQRVLLVNWSPACGFCRKITSELAELQPDLRERGVQLVLVSIGTPDDNRELLEEHNLDTTLLLQDQDRLEFFAGIGTPAAYLLDEDGNTASELSLGALDVPKLARELAGRPEPEPE
jgi:peroxiredoxin